MDPHPDFVPTEESLKAEQRELASLTWEELLVRWDQWLLAAQATNPLDEDEYSHGGFAIPRREWPEHLRESGRTRPRRGS